MKKSFVWISVAIIAFIFLFSACASTVSDMQTDTSTQQEKPSSGEPNTASNYSTDSNEPTNKTSSPADDLPEYQAGSIRLDAQDQDDYNFDRKYRVIYYQIKGEFSELLSEEEYQDYTNWVDEKSKADGYGEYQTEMLLVSFIKRYNITREEFDSAVEKYIANSKAIRADMMSETNEAPNGDIIYTFDNEIINRYYRYE